jgi:hypothetical protein
MKIIKKIKNTPFLREADITTRNSCSIVGNSGVLFGGKYGQKIDSNVDVIRFNNAICENFEEDVGQKTTFRIMNCHYILNIVDESYFNHQKSRFPDQDRFFTYKLKNENIIFKTDPSWKLWKHKNVLSNIQKNNNNVYFIDEKFYNLGKKINKGSEPTNGFMGLLFALKYYKNIECFGFSFYKEGVRKHYYDDVICDSQRYNHDFDLEEKWFSLLEKNNIIKIYR